MHLMSRVRLPRTISTLGSHSSREVRTSSGLIKDRAALPERLLDINGLSELTQIEVPQPGGGIHIGALARAQAMSQPIRRVRERLPAIAEGLLFAASAQLRNMASIGGNIMQRTRCAYFRDDDDPPCNKRRPESGCSALHGINRNHAIFGWTESCAATHPSDVAVAFAAMDAIVLVRGSSGERSIPFAEFHRLPGSTPERDNVLERGELIIAIEVPGRPEGARLALPQGPRPAILHEFALVSAAAAVATEGVRIRSARLALGGVAHKPWRLPAAEQALVGIALSDTDKLRAAIALSFADVRPLAHNAFKIELAQRVALHALQTAGERA